MEYLPRFQLIEYDDAEGELKTIYDEIMHVFGLPFVPNWFKCQGANPSLLRGNWDKVKYTLLMGQVPRLLKELIIYNISKERRCTYCSFAHKVSADMQSQSLGWEQTFKLTEHLDSDFMPPSYKTAIQVVTRCALEPLATTNDDFEQLADEGFSEGEILELMAQADLANLLITIAEISGIEIDEEFFLAFHQAPPQPFNADTPPLQSQLLIGGQTEDWKTSTPRCRLVAYQEANDEVRAIYDDVMNVMGLPFVMNVIKSQGESPLLLRGMWHKVKTTLYGGEIPMLLKQLIMYNVSKSRGCNYCTFIHRMTADSLGSLLHNDEGFHVTENLANDLIPPSYQTAIEIVTRWALTPSLTINDDFEMLRDEGFSERELQELMSIADLINMLNTMADIFGVEIDPELFVSIS